MNIIHNTIILIKNHLRFLFFPAVFIFLLSCGKEETNEPVTARVYGRIVTPTTEYISLKKSSLAQDNTDSVRLSEKGEYEFIVSLDSLTEYTLVYGLTKESDTLKREEDLSIIISEKTQELPLLLDKGFDLKIWVDTKDPMKSLSVSGTGAELNKYIATKSLLVDEFNLAYVSKLNSPPEEYFGFLANFRSNTENLLAGLPSNSPTVPPGFKEREQKSFFYTFNRLSLSYVNKNYKDIDSAGIASPDKILEFVKYVPFDDREELVNPAYMLLISEYIEFLINRETGGKALPRSEMLEARHRKLGELFTDPEVRSLVLYFDLMRNTSYLDSAWYRSALDQFFNSPANDTLKNELRNIEGMK